MMTTDTPRLTAVIVEDEERSRLVLRNLLEAYCPDVEILGEAGQVAESIRLIGALRPSLVFLDVQIGGGTGFDVLTGLEGLDTAVIFTTAYDHYALRAFRFSAVDYLLKPIDIEELQAAVRKVRSANRTEIDQFKIKTLLSNIRHPEEDPVLLVSTQESVEFVRIRDIIRCEAQGAYTLTYIRDQRPVLVSKVIKEFEYLLQDYGFYRVHQSHVVNLREVRKYVKADNCLLMRDGAMIQLARSRKEDFFAALHKVQL